MKTEKNYLNELIETVSKNSIKLNELDKKETIKQIESPNKNNDEIVKELKKNLQIKEHVITRTVREQVLKKQSE